MNSTRIIKKDLLESQNLKLQEQCSLLKHRFSLVRRKLSQQMPPIDKDLTTLNQRLQIYKTEYTQLSKTFLHIKTQSSPLDLEKIIQEQESHLKSLQKENQKLANSINFNSKSKNNKQDRNHEITLMQSLISKLEQISDETQKLILDKKSKFSELVLKINHLKSLAGSKKSKKNDLKFESIEKAEDYLKNVQKSYTNSVSKYVKIINDLETQLFELKDQETILYSTYIKKKQQHRLILTMGESDVKENYSEDRQALDVKFYYKPTIKYLYI